MTNKQFLGFYSELLALFHLSNLCINTCLVYSTANALILALQVPLHKYFATASHM